MIARKWLLLLFTGASLAAACSSSIESAGEVIADGMVIGGDTGGNGRGKDTGGKPGDAGSDPGRTPADATPLPDNGNPQPDNGNPQPDNGNPQPDVQAACTPGTACFEDKWKIMGSKITVIVNQDAYNPEWYLLDLLPPGTMSVTVLIRSTGFNQLTLVDAFLEAGGNQFISFQWTTPGYPAALPATLMVSQEAQGQITYTPTGADSLPFGAKLHIWSSDPDWPERVVEFYPRQSGPDIMIPFAAKNYGCGTYCHGRDFSIENGGNKPLIIQSMQLVTPSSEWSIVGAPAPGTTLAPAGSPGYAPIPFTVEYCDADGNLKDDNKVAIYSNDPDENPAYAFLHVIQPDECP